MPVTALNTSFRYEIDINLLLNNKEVQIPIECVKSIVTEYSYDTSNMPVIFLSLRISKYLYKKMIENMDTSEIIFSMYKYDTNTNMRLKKRYVHDRFIYMMPSDVEYNSKIKKTITGENQEYEDVIIGLLKIDLLNDNKRFINDIIKNSNIASIIHKYTNHMNMVIEPFDINKTFDQLIIPPVESITQLISYLNINGPLYSTSYRLFRDFDRTFLLSTKGKSVSANDSTYDTIIVRISDLDIIYNMELNNEQKCYIINTIEDDVRVSVNKIKDKSYNTLLGITSAGDTQYLDLNIAKNKDSSEKVILKRIANDNIEYLKNIRNDIEGTSVVIEITKTDIDSSILNPNKEILLQSHNSYKEYNGRYLLAYKKEVLIQTNNEFASSVRFGLRKVVE